MSWVTWSPTMMSSLRSVMSPRGAGTSRSRTWLAVTVLEYAVVSRTCRYHSLMNMSENKAATTSPSTRRRMTVRGAEGSLTAMTRSTTVRRGRMRGPVGSCERAGRGALGLG